MSNREAQYQTNLRREEKRRNRHVRRLRALQLNDRIMSKQTLDRANELNQLRTFGSKKQREFAALYDIMGVDDGPG